MDLKTLQKLRFFLAAAFPVLARLPPFTARVEAWLARHPRLKARLDRIRESQLAASARRANEMFVTGDYAGDRIDENLVPPETVQSLRAAVIGAILLCLLVPLAMRVDWPALALEQISGAAGEPVAGWSVVLWMLGAALAWAFLLAGTGLANRGALPPALAVFIYFNLAMSAALPRSWWGLLLLAITLVAIVGGEARAAGRAGAGAWPGLVACILNGMMAGVLGLATSPAGALFKGQVLAVGSAAGAGLGVLLWWLARKLARRGFAPEGTPRRWLRADAIVAGIAALHFVYTLSLAVRGGLLVPAQGLHPVAVQMPGYLWPLYYFIGVGVVFKVLRQTKLIHGTVQDLVSGRVLIALGLVFLVAATAVAWSDAIVLQPGRAWLPGMQPAAEWIASVTMWLWREPLWGLTMEWMRWVFLVVLALALWAAARRRLSGELMAMLLFPALLLWLGIAEYFFEFASFGKSPMQSAASLLGFAIFILWLGHMALRQFLVGDSAWWPRVARVILYGAGLMFVLLPVHARAAMHDRTLANEIFLYLFFGILDLGLPYYLHVYASRHFQRLPLAAVQVLGFFALGALLSVPCTILDKLAVADWSFAAVAAQVDAQVASILEHGRLPDGLVPFLPPAWIVGRALLVWGVILGVGMLVHRRIATRELAPAATMFAVLAVATGLACFANRAVELPLLPPSALQLITPMRVSRAIDVALVARYLSFVVPALVVGLALIGTSHRAGRAAVISGAIGLHVAITWLWPTQEPWLRSTGLLAVSGAAGGLTLIGLVVIVRDRLATVLFAKEQTSEATRFLTPRELRVVGWCSCIGLAMLGTWQLIETRLVTRRVLEPAVIVALPALWRDAPAANGVAIWHGPLRGTLAPLLTLTVRPCEAGNTRAVLQTTAQENAQQLNGFTPVGLEPWDQFHPGAIALEFQFERQLHGYAVSVMGTTVVAPAGPDSAFVFTVLYELGDRERRWDVVRTLRERR